MNDRDNMQSEITRRTASHTRLTVLALTCAVFLAGCAATGGGGTSGTGAVVKRAEARWAALLAGDFETAYQYYSPGYRSSTSRGDFELAMRLRKVQFRDARFAEHTCEGDRCDLRFKVKYHVASPVPGLDQWESDTIIDETWIRTQDQWWYLPEDS